VVTPRLGRAAVDPPYLTQALRSGLNLALRVSDCVFRLGRSGVVEARLAGAGGNLALQAAVTISHALPGEGRRVAKITQFHRRTTQGDGLRRTRCPVSWVLSEVKKSSLLTHAFSLSPNSLSFSPCRLPSPPRLSPSARSPSVPVPCASGRPPTTVS